MKGRQMPDDLFGASVAISGSTAIVGEPTFDANSDGRAYVFTKTVKGWERIAELKGSATQAVDGFGDSVAITGTTAVVGAWGSDDVGSAYVFSEKKGAWKQTAELKDPNTGVAALGDHFGSSVAMSGAVAVVGAPGDDLSNGAGRAYVFTETKGAWKRTAVVRGSTRSAGRWPSRVPPRWWALRVATAARKVAAGPMCSPRRREPGSK